MNNQIVITTSSFGAYSDKPIKMLEDAGFHIKLNPYKRKLTKEESLELLPGHRGVIAGIEVLDKDVLEKSDLKVISRCGAGISNVDLKTAERLGIEVCNTPDAPTNSVAELTIAGILNCLRQIPQMNELMHQGQWERQNGFLLEGKTVLIIGYGRVGRRVATLLKPFDVEIVIYDPYVSETGMVSLEEGLKQADIITFHCSGEECLLDEGKLNLVKDSAIICNVARGGLIDEAALVKTLKAGRLSGCWLDTFDQEPYDGLLTEIDRVLLTPHIGSFTRECRIQMEQEAVQNIIQGLKEKI